MQTAESATTDRFIIERGDGDAPLWLDTTDLISRLNRDLGWVAHGFADLDEVLRQAYRYVPGSPAQLAPLTLASSTSGYDENDYALLTWELTDPDGVTWAQGSARIDGRA